MCGIAGYLSPGRLRGEPEEQARAMLARMARAIAHRGPDDSGLWTSMQDGVGLGHRRLSVVDLSAAGHQPMASAGGRFVVVYNGEIYNHMALRSELARQGRAPRWRGHSDTETLAAGFEAWGVRGTLQRARGMFALAVWDRELRTLVLARDRMGEKPLYYGWQRGDFLFGSELKALKEHPSFAGETDRGALRLFMRYGYLPMPFSIYEGIFKLPPGSLLTVSADRPEPQVEAYWSVVQAQLDGAAHRFAGTEAQAVDRLDELLRGVIAEQVIADVPVGAFLSGGIDSSLVVALMQAQAAKPTRTFTIGFGEAAYNEAHHAKAVAAHLRTEHTELYVSDRQARDVIALLPALYDEPFADSSQIPTYLLSALTRGQVTVSLSGDGGDELFGGYQRYSLAAGIWGKLSRLPAGARRLAGAGIGAVPPAGWDASLGRAMKALGSRFAQVHVGDKMHKLAGVLGSGSSDDLYRRMVTHWDDPGQVVAGGVEPVTALGSALPEIGGLAPTERMMVRDMLTYLPDDILVKVDRAGMAVSLESRIPFLDHRVVEFAASLPLSMKLSQGRSKRVLHDLLLRYVPNALVDRPKMGFGVPIDSWLRGPLRDWAEDLLDESRMREEGFLHPAPILAKWREHLSGRRNWQNPLWTVLMFQAWHRHGRR